MTLQERVLSTYSLMESESNKILHVETIDKREVNLKYPNMEREAFKRSMDYLISRGIKISEVVTDASPTVISTTGNYNFSVSPILYFVIQKNQPVRILISATPWMYGTNLKR